MYFSRMYLNPRRRATRNLVGNPQVAHAMVMSAFPPGNHSADDGRILWRLDQGRDSLALYVVSPTKPSFEHIQEQAGWSASPTWDIREYQPVLDAVTVGKRFGFRLAANPVRTVTDPETGKKRRCAHVTPAQQTQWLTDRADQLGVKFIENDAGLQVAVTKRENLRFKRGNGRVTIARTQFDGALEVVEPAKFVPALTRGVGKAKGYGCGMLTVAPWQGGG